MIWSVSSDPPLRGGDGESNEMCWSAIFHASRKFITKAIPESIETIQRKNSVIAQVLDSEGNILARSVAESEYYALRSLIDILQ